MFIIVIYKSYACLAGKYFEPAPRPSLEITDFGSLRLPKSCSKFEAKLGQM